MKKVTKSAYAKVNLTLEVFPPREDGYHDIETVMHKLTLCDNVTVAKVDAGIRLVCSKDICAEKDNLAYKAAARFFEVTGCVGGCEIYIDKVIPDRAGLAGGSADAAAVLDALSELYGVRDDSLIDGICEGLGSDIVFCREKYICAKAFGRGEKVVPLPPLAKMYVLTAVPSEGLSTKAVYSAYDKCGVYQDNGGITFTEGLSKKLESGSYAINSQDTFNSFEEVCKTLLPEIANIMKLLSDTGAEAVRMSGSGSAVYALYRSEALCLRAKESLQAHKGLRFLGCFETLGE